MKRKPKFDLEYIVQWIIFISIVLGVAGGIVKLIRWGAITESGSIVPTEI